MNIRDVLKRKGTEVHAIDATKPLAAAIARFSEAKHRCLVVTDAETMVGVLTIRDTLLHLDRHGAEGLSQPVRQAMTQEVISVTPESTLAESHELFAKKNINHLPVLADGRLVGLVTRVDVLTSRALSAEEINSHLHEYISGTHL